MKSKSLTPLGETEMEILHHVWALDRATVAQVRERVLATRTVAYTTVMTVMRNLADKGFLQFDKEGTTYVYSAARTPEDVQRSLVDDLVHKVFQGSATALVQTLVGHEDLSDDERRDIKHLIDQMEDPDEPAP